jgi:hypothetical protein
MEQNFQAEIAQCLEEVTAHLLRQRDRYEEMEKDGPKPVWYSGSGPLPMPK